MVKKEIS
ncbi:nef attachable domain protein, partial [Chlamydia psittaci 02DC14]